MDMLAWATQTIGNAFPSLARDIFTPLDEDRLNVGISMLASLGGGSIRLMMEKGKWRFTEFDWPARHLDLKTILGIRANTIPLDDIRKGLAVAIPFVSAVSGYGQVEIKVEQGKAEIGKITIRFDRLQTTI